MSKPRHKRDYLTGVDILFGGLSSPNRAYIAGGGLSIFEPPFDTAKVNPASIEAFLKDTRNYGRWVQKLYPEGEGGFWRRPFFSAENFEFDIKRQFTVVDVKKPTEESLRDTVSHLLSQPLDLEHSAAWHCYYLRGLPNGAVGFLDRVQHALTDGEGHIRNSLTAAPEAKSGDDASAKSAQYAIRRNSIIPKTAMDGVRKFLMTVWSFIVSLGLSLYFALFVVPFKAPAQRKSVVFPDKRPHNPTKQCAWSPKSELIDLSLVKDLKNKLGVSLNDVILASATAAIETYLMERKGLLDKHLYFALPTSFRHPSDGSLSNRLLYYTLLCPDNTRTSSFSLVDRAKAIAKWMGWQRKMRPSAQMMIWLLNGLLKTAWLLPVWVANRVTAQSHGGISNVPGPAAPLLFNGVPISRMNVLNPLSHGAVGQLGVAVISYCGKFSFGVMMERDGKEGVFGEGGAARIVELFGEEMKKLAMEVDAMEAGGVKKESKKGK